MEPKKIEKDNRWEIEENYHGWKIRVVSSNGCWGWIISKPDKDGQEIEYWEDYGNDFHQNSALSAAKRCCIKLETFLALNQFLLELHKKKKLNCHEYTALYDSLFNWIYKEK